MTRRTRLSFAFVLLTACTGDTLGVGGDAPLEKDDVQGLPAGNASGTAATGAYIITSADQRSCTCRGGNEAELCDTALVAGALWMVQDDGALQVRLVDSFEILDEVVLDGGIDDDGRFEVGGVNVITIVGDPSGETLNAVAGSVRPREGGALTWLMRSQLVAGSESVDCTMTFDLEFSWWDPDSIASCNTPFDCHPERPYCVDEVCTDGALGSACSFGSDCASDFCVDDVCTGGEPGDPCTFRSDCRSESCDGRICG